MSSSSETATLGEQPRVELPDLAAGGNVGCGVAVYDDYAVVGACAASVESGSSGELQAAGVAHSLRVASRRSTGLVLPPVAFAAAAYGTAMAMGADPTRPDEAGVLVVGAPGETYDRGSVYLRTRAAAAAGR